MPAYGKQSGRGPVPRLNSVTDLVEIAGNMTASAVAVAGGDRIEDLRLVESARDHGIVERIILIGNKERINRALDDVGIEVSPRDIVHSENDEEVAAATVKLIGDGVVDIVLKGDISTPVLNRHMLTLAVRSTVSLVSIFDADPISGGRPVILTDAGVTTVCNFGRMADLVRNAVNVAQVVMGIDRPRVAILSANEKQIASLQSTWLGSKLSERTWPDADVYGPLSFDLATDPASVAIKGLPDRAAAGKVAGNADILVCPGIDSANILYKAISSMVKYGQASIAGITVGFPVPYIILSRADSLQTRLESIALCSIYVQRSGRKDTRRIPAERRIREKIYRILTVSLTSKSIKIALYENERCINETEVVLQSLVERARTEDMSGQAHAEVSEDMSEQAQAEDMAGLVIRTLDQWDHIEVDAVAVRELKLPDPGRRIRGGTYPVSEKQDGKINIDSNFISSVQELHWKSGVRGMSIPVAAALAQKFEVPAFAVIPNIDGKSAAGSEPVKYPQSLCQGRPDYFHILTAAKEASEETGRPVDDINLVVAYLGESFTAAAVSRGKIIDVSPAVPGCGPLSVKRDGNQNVSDLITMYCTGNLFYSELVEELKRSGKVPEYAGRQCIEADEKQLHKGEKGFQKVADALAYEISKEVGRMFAAAGCDVEAIVLTGGLVRDPMIKTAVRRRAGRLAPVIVLEGSIEMSALAREIGKNLSGRGNQ